MPRAPRRIAFALVLALAALLGAPAGARADDDTPERRHLRIVERGGWLLCWGSFTDVFDEELLDELSSGFVTTIVVRTYVIAAGSNTPVAFAAATYRVVYDLWDEVYIVQVHDPAGERETRQASRAEALKEATALRAFPVAVADAVVPGEKNEHYIAVVVEVNPVSQELLAEVHRWLARPQGSQGPGNSFFGSFVSVFVNPPVAEADRTLRFRSQKFYRTGP